MDFTDARSRWIPGNPTDKAIGTIIWARRVAIMALTVSVIGEVWEKGVNQQRWMDVWVNYLDQKS